MNLNETLDRLRNLSQPVPKPLRLPTEQEVAAAEQKLGVHFEPSYRQYLLTASNVVFGVLEPAVVIPNNGYLDLVHMATTAWEKVKLPRNLLPICEDNGDYYCVMESGEICYWSHNGWDGRKWKDLATWINSVWIDEFLEMRDD